MTTARISFLMPLYNGLEFTRESIRTLQETVDLTPHEIILINDASRDGTAEYLDGLKSPFRVLHNTQHANYAASMNRGVAASSGEILCLLNNDLVFRPGWLPPMLKVFERFLDAGMVGNVQFNPRTKRYDHMGMVFDAEGIPRHFGRHFTFRPFHGYTEWRAVTAACCLVKKSVFLAAGGFEETYKNGCEDVDLCLTLGKMGRRHYVSNDSVIGHHVSSSPGRELFNSANEQLLMERWREYILRTQDARERRRVAANYALRFLTQPWRYNGPKLCRSLITLLKFGR